MSIKTFEKLPEDKKERILSAGIREFSLKTYKDASTDSITKESQISKGILFHYFGSKKQFYLYCLEQSMERLTAETEMIAGREFHEILFAEMNRKVSLCRQYQDEMRMVNMASRDASTEIAPQKAELIQRYMIVVQQESGKTIRQALALLKLKDEENRQMAEKGLQIYISAMLNQYLLQYQQIPDQFFENSETIKKELNEYLDLMLYGICQ